MRAATAKSVGLQALKGRPLRQRAGPERTRCHAHLRFECSVKRSDGSKAAFERDGQDRNLALCPIAQSPLSFLNTVVVEELIEVRKAHAARDALAHLVFRCTQPRGEVCDFQISFEISALLGDRSGNPVAQQRIKVMGSR